MAADGNLCWGLVVNSTLFNLSSTRFTTWYVVSTDVGATMQLNLDPSQGQFECSFQL